MYFGGSLPFLSQTPTSPGACPKAVAQRARGAASCAAERRLAAAATGLRGLPVVCIAWLAAHEAEEGNCLATVPLGWFFRFTLLLAILGGFQPSGSLAV